MDRKTYRVSKGERAPERDELDDNDESQWPSGPDGDPTDPWVYQYLIPFEDVATGDVVIFVTPSVGGRIAVGDLCMAWTRRTKKMPNSGQPIIKLAVGTMPTKKFGKVPRPLFKIVGWDEPSGDIDVLPPDKSRPDDAAGGDFEDSIPF